MSTRWRRTSARVLAPVEAAVRDASWRELPPSGRGRQAVEELKPLWLSRGTRDVGGGNIGRVPVQVVAGRFGGVRYRNCLNASVRHDAWSGTRASSQAREKISSVVSAGVWLEVSSQSPSRGVSWRSTVSRCSMAQGP